MAQRQRAFAGPTKAAVKGPGPHAGQTYLVEADAKVIATGARPVEIPGFAFDGNRVVDSKGALAFAEVRRRLVVIGAGYIGMDIGTLWARMGSQVTFVEAMPNILQRRRLSADLQGPAIHLDHRRRPRIGKLSLPS
jgi:dihydrolipoamide dehydrogenase